MARCNASWLPALWEPREGLWRPEPTFRAYGLKTRKVFLCTGKAWSELFQKRLSITKSHLKVTVHFHIFLLCFFCLLYCSAHVWLNLLEPLQYNKKISLENGSTLNYQTESQMASGLQTGSDRCSPCLGAPCPSLLWKAGTRSLGSLLHRHSIL